MLCVVLCPVLCPVSCSLLVPGTMPGTVPVNVTGTVARCYAQCCAQCCAWYCAWCGATALSRRCRTADDWRAMCVQACEKKAAKLSIEHYSSIRTKRGDLENSGLSHCLPQILPERHRTLPPKTTAARCSALCLCSHVPAMRSTTHTSRPAS